VKRIAFMGFRHAHINDLFARAEAHPDLEIVACCEEDEGTCARLAADGKVTVTHRDFTRMLAEVECDIIAVGDYYAKRGPALVQAVLHGRHIIADKPMCTQLNELEQIAHVAAEKRLAVGCMLDLRNNGTFRTLRRLVREGALGEIQAVSFGGQHPLLYGSRPRWYFEAGKHGGTINDIAIHGIDIVEWITGERFTEINAARNWNGVLKDVPFFKDCAQVMLTMANGGGVIGDVSYLSPDSFGYGLPMYWRITLWGTGGVVEASSKVANPQLYRAGDKAMQEIQSDPPLPGGYLQAFLDEIDGKTGGLDLTTAEVLRASRVTLLAQDAADRGLTNVPV